ncbi:endonuclease domain-containing protein [Acinetobacter baumannii]
MLLIGKKFEEEKIRLYHSQKGICPLCKRKLDDNIKSNHLDHDHSLEGPNAGKVRALLCGYCNNLEGQIKHKFNSSGLKTKGVDISDWLENLVAYYRMDLSDHNIHPQYINDMTKLFSNMDIPSMDNIASKFNIEFPPKTTKAKRVPIFKKGLKLFFKGEK